MRIQPPPPDDIGSEITGVDVRRMTASELAEAKAALYAHKLIVFRDQTLTLTEYVACAKQFGTPQIYFQPNYHHPDHPEVFVSANVPLDGKKIGVAGTGRYWHTDCQFFDDPLPLTMLHPHTLPETRRETRYIDMARVYRELPPALRAFADGTRAIHDAKLRYKVQPCDVDKSLLELMEEFTKMAPPVTHPTVIRHPVTGAPSLYVSSGFTVGFAGLSHEASTEALSQLTAFAEQPRFVHTHTWRAGDVLLWDNRPLLHMAGSSLHGEPSVSFRIGIYDGLPFYPK